MNPLTQYELAALADLTRYLSDDWNANRLIIAVNVTDENEDPLGKIVYEPIGRYYEFEPVQ